MAKEYIERDAVLKEQKTFTEYDEGGWDAAVRAVPVNAIKSIPTADVVEVVRCKDCKHWNEDALACDLLPWVDSSEHENWYAEDFCSYGEREDNDGNEENL